MLLCVIAMKLKAGADASVEGAGGGDVKAGGTG